MRRSNVVKEFSVERQRRLRRLAKPDEISNADLYRAIMELRDEIAALEEAVPSAAALGTRPDASVSNTNPVTDTKEAIAARIEIAQMVRMIGRAKMEIASIKHPKTDDDRMLTATNELDAIVVATETSTEDILSASERIEGMIRRIAALHPDDEDVLAISEQIANEIIKIFEACSFQDITGQRITKVVKTIRYIEERVLALINIWGAEAFMELPVPENAQSGDDGLMSGPQLPNQGISQEDINALFE
ncbi:MAG: hypothetical protein D6826_09065 [Alphaproteobacteria bacterium]|nr:MAG: hypothetical protein D6826_09065 [Alphaproteobacteria bacterium]